MSYIGFGLPTYVSTTDSPGVEPGNRKSPLRRPMASGICQKIKGLFSKSHALQLGFTILKRPSGQYAILLQSSIRINRPSSVTAKVSMSQYIRFLAHSSVLAIFSTSGYPPVSRSITPNSMLTFTPPFSNAFFPVPFPLDGSNNQPINQQSNNNSENSPHVSSPHSVNQEQPLQVFPT